MPKVVTLPDGTLASCVIIHRGPGIGITPIEQDVSFQYSKDNGQTWSDREVVAKLPSVRGGFGFGIPLADKDGEIHIFLLCDGNTGIIRARTEPGVAPIEPIARQYLGVWYLRSQNGRTAWTEVKSIHDGRVSDLQSACQLKSGRIVLPFAHWTNRSWRDRSEGFAAFNYTGSFDTTALYSDDRGETWKQSSSFLRIPSPSLTAHGAIEPVIVQLNDGRVWMLIRGQTGVFYESYSTDDAQTWSPPMPTSIVSSDSPAGLTRLDEKRILMIWNNCQRYAYALGGRQVLHGAVTDDDGKTWRGWREILRDPLRNQPSPASGDHGVAYPYPTLAKNGTIIYSLWVQSGDGRSINQVDPKWLMETRQRDDFSDGSTETWSHFGCKGASVVDAPGAEDGKALRLAKTEADWPCGAVRNFPMGRSGTVSMRIKAEQNPGPMQLMLTDHFSPPFDLEDTLNSVFHATIAAVPEGAKTSFEIPRDRWSMLSMKWNMDAQRCDVSIDGKPTVQLKTQRSPKGVCYLRLRSDPTPAEAAGYLIDHVDVEVQP